MDDNEANIRRHTADLVKKFPNHQVFIFLLSDTPEEPTLSDAHGCKKCLKNYLEYLLREKLIDVEHNHIYIETIN